MDKIKGIFGFGCMRPPMIGEEVDINQVQKMVDSFMDSGLNYFDTAHVYVNGKSEEMLKICLTSKYPRESYFLTDKLSGTTFQHEGGVKPIIETELKACGVKYFDCLLMHAQNAVNYEKFKKCRAYEQAFELKEEGKVRHVGLSFHDQPEVLDKILTEYPAIEVVQLQFNYLDFDNASVRSKDCYDVCVKHGKPVIVMEPVKGGHLVNIPEEAKKITENLGISPAQLAIRFAASFDNIKMVLSGMSTIEQLEENVSFMKDFKPLTEEEMKATEEIKHIIQKQGAIECTSCRYCVDGCPKNILIPNLFACLNAKNVYDDWHAEWYYNNVHTVDHGLASSCIKCGKCEASCPQHLPIRSLLEQVAKAFENKKEK